VVGADAQLLKFEASLRSSGAFDVRDLPEGTPLMGGASVDDYYEDHAPAAKRGRQVDSSQYVGSSGSGMYGRAESAPRADSAAMESTSATAYGYGAATEVAAVAETVAAASDEGYCICGGAGSGDMIMCDNPNCKYGGGWFHLACVGLTESPGDEASWYCPNCRPLMIKSGRKQRK
jgi:hypothetical protein